MSRGVSIKFDSKGAMAGLDSLVATTDHAVRPAAQAGAQELYNVAKTLCPVSDATHYFYGSASKKAPAGQKKQFAYQYAPGNLRDSIYQVYSKDNSGVTKATYHVSWNYSKAPYGFMVEYGTSRAPAHPFLRPAFDTTKRQALQAAKARFVAEMKKAGVQ